MRSIQSRYWQPCQQVATNGRCVSSQRAKPTTCGRVHSESGWMKGDVFCEYLRHVREYEPSGRRLVLILDAHPSHCTGSVKREARSLNIRLIYIPPGATDEMQPLDRKVFGALKSEARRLFRQSAAENPASENLQKEGGRTPKEWSRRGLCLLATPSRRPGISTKLYQDDPWQ
jgi:hypothetical protein